MCPHCTPLVWIGFLAFFGGLALRLVIVGRMAKREKVVFPIMDARYGLRSVAHWIVPFGSRNMRMRPLFTVVSFAFHICLLATPLFALGHAVLWRHSWGIPWLSLPQLLIDAMTLVVIGGGLFFLIRRAVMPEVRKVTSLADVLIVLLVISPYVTGFVSRMQWFRSLLSYDAILTIHVVSGAAWLAAIPFTRLAHALWFVFTRSYMGSEFGSVRHARDW